MRDWSSTITTVSLCCTAAQLFRPLKRAINRNALPGVSRIYLREGVLHENLPTSAAEYAAMYETYYGLARKLAQERQGGLEPHDLLEQFEEAGHQKYGSGGYIT